jgi:hypothetical protein
MTIDYTITEEDYLLRRYPKLNEPRFLPFFKIINGVKIPTSAAFKTKPNEDGLSVEISALTTLEMAVSNKLTFGLAEFSAKIPMESGFECVYNPLEGIHAHALILGDTNPIAKKLSRSVHFLHFSE